MYTVCTIVNTYADDRSTGYKVLMNEWFSIARWAERRQRSFISFISFIHKVFVCILCANSVSESFWLLLINQCALFTATTTTTMSEAAVALVTAATLRPTDEVGLNGGIPVNQTLGRRACCDLHKCVPPSFLTPKLCSLRRSSGDSMRCICGTIIWYVHICIEIYFVYEITNASQNIVGEAAGCGLCR